MNDMKFDNELYNSWRALDKNIMAWWDGDVRKANEEEIRDPRLNQIWYSDEEHRKKEKRETEGKTGTLLFLPFPYISSAGSEDAFPEMYCWDIPFINSALYFHDRLEFIRNHLLNHLFMIQRFGMVLNGNRTYYTTRSQTPLLADDVWRYYQHTKDLDLLSFAYPLLKSEFLNYWNGEHHQTPIKLATNRDLGDPELRPELAAEAEVLDFTPIYDGDIRNCVPLQTNCALVRYADCLASIARELKRREEAVQWKTDADTRRDLIRQYCWNQEKGFFFEYNYVQERQLPYWSICAYWTLWADVAKPDEADRLVEHLEKFEFDYGLALTDKIYPSPHPEFEWLQWEYPSGWPPMQMMVVDALNKYGFNEEARRIAKKYVTVIVEQYQVTGKMWEKYNVVDGNLEFPRERYNVPPFHGWTSAAAVVLGHQAFQK